MVERRKHFFVSLSFVFLLTHLLFPKVCTKKHCWGNVGGAASSERTLMPLLYLSAFSAGSSISYLGLYASYKVGFTAHPASPSPKENHKESIKVTFLTIVQGDEETWPERCENVPIQFFWSVRNVFKQEGSFFIENFPIQTQPRNVRKTLKLKLKEGKRNEFVQRRHIKWPQVWCSNTLQI